MPKLNQIVAVVNGKKTQAQKGLTDLYKKLQQGKLFEGLVRTYQPVDEDGDTLPPEKTLVRYRANEVIDEAQVILENLIDTVATQDYANTQAKGDIKVDDQVLAAGVPVTHLMFLEKQLVDIHSFVSKLPTLDETSEWHFDENKGCFVSETETKNRDLKTVTHKVTYEATEHHPAQVAEVAITKKAGEFATTKLSGAVGVSRKVELLKRVSDLQDAVKFAREQANAMDVENKRVAEPLLNYIFS